MTVTINITLCKWLLSYNNSLCNCTIKRLYSGLHIMKFDWVKRLQDCFKFTFFSPPPPHPPLMHLCLLELMHKGFFFDPSKTSPPYINCYECVTESVHIGCFHEGRNNHTNKTSKIDWELKYAVEKIIQIALGRKREKYSLKVSKRIRSKFITPSATNRHRNRREREGKKKPRTQPRTLCFEAGEKQACHVSPPPTLGARTRGSPLRQSPKPWHTSVPVYTRRCIPHPQTPPPSPPSVSEDYMSYPRRLAPL